MDEHSRTSVQARAFHPIPQVAYEKMKIWLRNHIWIHYLFHLTFCSFKDAINKGFHFYTPSNWMEHTRDLVDDAFRDAPLNLRQSKAAAILSEAQKHLDGKEFKELEETVFSP